MFSEQEEKHCSRNYLKINWLPAIKNNKMD